MAKTKTTATKAKTKVTAKTKSTSKANSAAKTPTKAAPKAKAATSVKATTKAKAKTKAKPKQTVALLNETGNRLRTDRRNPKSEAEAAAAKPAVERRKGNRRRQIDPTTCERDYSELEIEFMQAMDEYKRASGRMFPTCSEILEVLIKVGYRKVAAPQTIYDPKPAQPAAESLENVEPLKEELD